MGASQFPSSTLWQLQDESGPTHQSPALALGSARTLTLGAARKVKDVNSISQTFPWDVGPGHANACENSNCPLSQCRLPKEKLRVRIFHLKGQENFGLAVKLQMCMAAARRRGKEASSVGHRERLLTTSSSRQQAISAFQGRCTAIDFPLTYQSKLGIIPSQLI